MVRTVFYGLFLLLGLVLCCATQLPAEAGAGPVMVPKNGDADDQATVRFIFSEDGGGRRFQADFSDTNGDVGTAFGIHQ